MFNQKAVTKLRAILIIDMLIVAVAGGIYIYLSSQGVISLGARPATFTLTTLTIDPPEAEVGEAVSISFNLTNVGDLNGNYTAVLMINDVARDNQTISLIPLESTNVTFTDTETVEGDYTVKIGELSGSFKVKPAPPSTSNIILSNLAITPYESNVGSSITITVNAKNPGTTEDSVSIKVTIDEVLVDSKTVKLVGGETVVVVFTITATSEGRHKISVNNLSASFRTVPAGMHTLMVIMSPTPPASKVPKFTIDGVEYTLPFNQLMPEATYKLVVPGTDPTGKYAFLHWEDGSTSTQRTITLTGATTLVAYFEQGTSCPSLFMWNGTSYVYVADISNHGWLGYINYMNEDGSITYYKNNPWDYVPLDRSQLAPTDGNFNLTLIQRWNEIFYLDQAYMLTVDHPEDVNVYSTLVEQYLDPNYMGKIYTVSKNPLTPVSAVNEKGENVLPQISKIDGVFTAGNNGITSPSWDNITWNRLTLDLGNLTDAPEIKLVINAIVDWGSSDDYNNWLNMFFAQPVPNGTQITPPPYMEVKDANGDWVRIPESRQIPLPPDTVARTYVVDLTGLFPTNDYSLRINNFWNVTFDYIGVDITPQQNVTIQRIDPQAYLYQSFIPGETSATGNFTRYGNVTQLVLNEDDEFVIGKQGDAVSLQFPITNLTAPAEGMVRDYFFFDACWFKDETGNWGFGFDFTVDPLPFKDMSGFPYSLQTEQYPSDPEHVNYLAEWNTRVISPP